MQRFHGVSALSMALALISPVVAQAQPQPNEQASVRSFAIPAGALAPALSAYSNLTGVQVIAAPAHAVRAPYLPHAERVVGVAFGQVRQPAR